MSADPGRCLTITLTGVPPVRIVCADWPILAEACDRPPRWLYRLVVRRSAEGRWIVSGVARLPGKPQRRGGELLGAQAVQDLICAAIRRCAEEIGAPAEIAQRCIAALPARAP